MKNLLLVGAIVLSINTFGQIVNIPDANFKAYLVGNTAINTNGDTEIQVSEANAFTGIINCSSLGITDLTGIEAFTALTELECYINQLTTIDVSQNTSLTNLRCDYNQLTFLDVSQNSALEELGCGGNQLTSLILSQNQALWFLWVSSNQLTSLDVTQNTSLTNLTCDWNQITSLNLSQNTSLTHFICHSNTSLECLNLRNGNNINFQAFNVLNNPSLTCIEVDDPAWSDANWIVGSHVDPQMYYSTNCNNACSVGVEELSFQNKELIKITNLLGQEVEYKAITPLIYIYSDGSTKRIMKLEE